MVTQCRPRESGDPWSVSVVWYAGSCSIVRTRCVGPRLRGDDKLSNLENLLLGLVQAVADAPGLDHVVVADRRPHRRRVVAGMHGETHILLDRHGLIGAKHRPLDHVVALAVGI